MVDGPAPMVPIRVIVDTNGLMAPFQLRFNLDEALRDALGRYELIVPRRVLLELRSLARTDVAAKGALALAQRYRVIEVDAKGDDALVQAAQLERAIVLTNDRLLRSVLRRAGVGVITLRKGHILVRE